MIIDITRPLMSGMAVYPGDPEFAVERVAGINTGAVSRVSLGTHTGTHVDAPCHVLENGAGVESYSPDLLCGPCLVSRSAQSVRVGRLLLKSLGRGLTPCEARRLTEQGLALVGTDRLSIGDGADDLEVHRVLLGRGVIVLEGLDLSRAPEGEATLICAPVLIAGADGAPARCFLIVEG